MNIGGWKSSDGSPITMLGTDENTLWFESTAMMSLYFVTDQ